jgi:hypothetical protein
MFSKIDELLNQSNLSQIWQERRSSMLVEKIDVTAWMVNLIENFASGMV